MDRRRFLKAAGSIGVASAGLGVGYTAIVDRASAQAIDISSSPRSVSNDRGDLAKVTIDPSFRIEWSDLDQAVAKVFYVIEARTREDGSWRDWSPIFRSTPWLTPGSLQGVSASKPGTTGHLEFSDGLAAILNRSSNSRNAAAEDPRALPRRIEVVNELGRPDYENADYSGIGGVDAASYLAGNSVGSADQAYSQLDSGRLSRPAGEPVEYGDSSLTDQGGTLPLVNNFPGAESGYYGAADNTDRLDVEEDGTTDRDAIELRYTFALQRLNESSVQWFVSGDFQNDYGGSIETAVREDPHLEHVRPSDVVSGNSELVMDGTDSYPSITNNGANTAASNVYDAYQAVAGSHPAVVVARTQFNVTVSNEAAPATPQGATGESGTGATGGGQ